MRTSYPLCFWCGDTASIVVADHCGYLSTSCSDCGPQLGYATIGATEPRSPISSLQAQPSPQPYRPLLAVAGLAGGLGTGGIVFQGTSFFGSLLLIGMAVWCGILAYRV